MNMTNTQLTYTFQSVKEIHYPVPTNESNSRLPLPTLKLKQHSVDIIQCIITYIPNCASRCATIPDATQWMPTIMRTV